MQINSINNVNFGLKYSNQMSVLILATENAAKNKGKEAYASFKKCENEIKNSFPISYSLFTIKHNCDNTEDIFLESPAGYKTKLLTIKQNEILDIDKLNEIKKKLHRIT